jgi:hypothetical protein
MSFKDLEPMITMPKADEGGFDALDFQLQY